MEERVCYYSKDDMSTGYCLELAEKCIHKFQKGNIPADLEGVIELYHIKQLFDNNCRFLKWSDVEFNKLKNVTTGFNVIIAKYFRTINPGNVVNEYSKLKWGYHQTF